VKGYASLGAGTGALTAHLAIQASRVSAFDKSKFMIAVARDKLALLRLSNCCVGLADHRCVPLPDASTDMVVAAWTMASLVYDCPAETWRQELDKAVLEMRRLVRPGGAVAVLCPANPGPRDYLSRLEELHGFSRTLYSSSWQFPAIATARKVIRFFFGEETWRVYRSRWPVRFVSRCGIWWRVDEPSA